MQLYGQELGLLLDKKEKTTLSVFLSSSDAVFPLKLSRAGGHAKEPTISPAYKHCTVYRRLRHPFQLLIPHYLILIDSIPNFPLHFTTMHNAI